MSTGKSRFEGTEKYSYLKKTYKNKITGFIPLPSKNDNHKLCNYSTQFVTYFYLQLKSKEKG